MLFCFSRLNLDKFAHKMAMKKKQLISVIAEDEEKRLPPLGEFVCGAGARAPADNGWEHLEEVVLHF